MKQIIVLTLSILLAPLLKSQDCNKPFAISFSKNSLDSIHVKWIHSGPIPSGYQIAYGNRGTTVDNAIKTDTFPSKNFTLVDLTPATQYALFVRAICTTGNDSGWNGPFAFTTHFNNPTDCGLSIALQDENCNFGGETYNIEIDNSGILGSDVFLESVDLLLEHPWLADMEIKIENPAGSQAILTQFDGAAQNNFGIINDLCDTLTRFSSSACISVTEGIAPFVGVYSPITSLVALNDGTPAAGIWKIHLCDRSAGDKGILRQLKLNLTPQLCEPIVDFHVSNIQGNTATLKWIAPFNCESIFIEYGPEGFQQGIGQGIIKQVNCKKEEIILDGLSPLTSYDYYLLGDCITSEAAPSCKSIFTSDCENKTLTSDFDQSSKCQNSCAIQCEITDSIWFNGLDNEIDWLVWQGATDTENTGPEFDINRTGNYIYVESSPEICGPIQKAELFSQCLFIGSKPECGIGFSYHMEGQDLGQLTLSISTDFGITWEEIFTAEKSEGWQRTFVHLDEYLDQYAIFKFEAITSNGEEGDIALDQIDFHGTIKTGENTIYLDDDLDGFGIVDSSRVICGPVPLGFALKSGDCDDNNPNIHPNATEILCNAIDENCNGLDDDNAVPPTLSVNTLKSESCFGLKDGILDISIDGSGAPYSVEWNNGLTGSRLKNLASGFYRATVTDVSSCAIVTPFYEIPVESKINVELVRLLNSTCTGRRDGEIEILPTGGVEPYSYEWNIDQIQATVIGLIAGSYQVTVTDAEGCTKVAGPYTVGVDKPLNVGTTLHKNVSCHGGGDGKLEINASNGEQPYTYKWAGGHMNNTIDQLFPGTYTATVTDRIGCQAIYTREITEPDSLYQVLLNIETIKCHGEKNGKIKTTTIGGTPPFTYQWNSGHNTDDIFGLGSGDYVLEVFDNNGCISTLDTITLDEPSPLDLQIDSIVSTTCRLSNDGAIYLNLLGGTAPYDYFWRRVEADSLVAVQLFPGNYGFTTIDKNDCKVSLPGIDVDFGNQASAVEIETLNAFICPDKLDGEISVEINTNAFPLNFNWSNGATENKSIGTDTIRQLGPGVYNVTITDNEGCVSVSSNVVFNSIESFSHTVPTFVSNDCPNDSSGIIGINITGGNAPYEYTWSNQKTTPAVGKLPNGFYHLTITDKNDCTFIISDIEMYSESNLSIMIEVTPSINNDQSGTIKIIPSAGVPNYQIEWQDTSIMQFTRANLPSGFYSATIYDQMGCSIDTTIFIDNLSSTTELDSDNIDIFPNPAKNLFQVKGIPNQFYIEAINTQGKRILSTYINQEDQVDVADWIPGMYILKIKNKKGQFVTKKLIKME